MTKPLIETELDKEKLPLGTGVIRDNSMIYYKNIQIILKTCRAEAEKKFDRLSEYIGCNCNKKNCKFCEEIELINEIKQIMKNIYG